MKRFNSNGFTFKHFFVAHDKSPMKVTTDSILLAAWAPLDDARNILDLGTGCGVIALILAQRTHDQVNIDGIDIDHQAILQAIDNVKRSPFTCLSMKVKDVVDYSKQNQRQYDLIVCNPPYYQIGVKCRTNQRQTARYTEKLTHQALLFCADRLLLPAGRLCLILPYMVAEQLQALAQQSGWYVGNQLTVSTIIGKPAKFWLMELSKQCIKSQIVAISIRDQMNKYTPSYTALVKDYYFSL